MTARACACRSSTTGAEPSSSTIHMVTGSINGRAVVGHVEPTVDWMFQQPAAEQILTKGQVDAVYTRLYPPWPFGPALRDWYPRVGGLSSASAAERAEFNRGKDNADVPFALQLAARVIESMVILGDPTAALRGCIPSSRYALSPHVRIFAPEKV